MGYLKKFENYVSKNPLLKLKNNEDIELISKILKEKNSGKLLEIACGNGSDAKYLAEKGFDVTCLEKNQIYVDEVNGKGVRCIKHDITNTLPFKENQFDVVYSRLGLHYFSTDILDKIFKDIYRVCNNNGIFIFSVKIESDSIKTDKVILSQNDWNDITKNSGFIIKSSVVKEGILYDMKSKWCEITSKKS